MKKLLILLLTLACWGESHALTLITSTTTDGVSNTIVINWGETDVSLNPPNVTLDRYQIRYKIAGGAATTIDNISNTLRTYTLSGLTSGQTYEVEVIEVIRVILPPSPYNILPYLDTPISSGISTVALNAPPVAVCTPLTVSVGNDCMAIVSASQIGAGSFDPNSDAITYGISPTGPFGVGTHSITLTVTDIYGATGTCVNTLTVVDSDAPKVQLKEAVVNLNANGIGTLNLVDVNNGITDNCGVTSVEISKTQFGCNDLGNNWVSVTVGDMAGNKTTVFTKVFVQEQILPNVVVKNATIFLNFEGYATLDAKDIDGGSWDLCSPVKLKLSKSIFRCEDVGSNSVTLIVTDGSGNESSKTAIVRVIDNTAPYVISKEVEVLVDIDGKTSLDLKNIDKLLYDACGISSVKVLEDNLKCDAKDQEINIIATDKHGNVNTFSTKVKVKDAIAPVVKTKPVSLYLDKSGKALLTTDLMDNGSTDNCRIDSIYVSKNTFSCENIGKDSVLFYVRDAYGNIAMKKEAITVIDSIKPLIITKDFNVILDTQGKGQISVEDIDGGSTDNCGIKSRTLSRTDFDCSQAGKITEITYVVEDISGNKTEKKLPILVTDNSKPVLKLKDNLVFNLDKDGFVKLSSNILISESTDNCGIKQTSVSRENFGCADIGIHEITISTTDNSGNISTIKANVTIADGEGNCLCSYAILASESVEINGTSIEYGGIGTYQPQKTVSISNATYGPKNVFVKSDVLSATLPPASVIKGVAPAPHPFEAGTQSSKKKVKVKNGKNEEFSEVAYGKVKIGKDAVLTYKGSGDLNLKTLKIKKGGKLNFEETVKVHISSYVRLGEEITINEKGENVKIYISKNLGVDQGSIINAYIHSQAGIEIKDAGNDKKTVINGLLTASKVKTGGNVVLKGQAVDCNSTQKLADKKDSLLAIIENQGTEEDQQSQPATKITPRITYGPNPATDNVLIHMGEQGEGGKVDITIRDGQGRVYNRQQQPLKENLLLDLSRLREGQYLIEINTPKEKNILRIQVLR